MRRKEYADDYRYFPEPDLVPIVLTDAYIEEICADFARAAPAATKGAMSKNLASRTHQPSCWQVKRSLPTISRKL